MRLHSAYNPQREAQKYIDSLDISPQTAYFILIECGLGYVIPVLRGKYPRATIVSLHASAAFMSDAALQGCGDRKARTPDAEWSPASGCGCGAFLERHIADVESDRIKIVEWRPALSLDGKIYLEILAETVAFIKRADAGKRTVSLFAERWRRNAETNVRLFAKTVAQTAAGIRAGNGRHLVVCASGPSLEARIDAIGTLQTRGYAVLSVSSAYTALRSRGVEPDIVFTSDGGNWARLHLFDMARHSTKKPLIAAALAAALLPDFTAWPLLLFSDASAEQDRLMQKHALPPLRLPQRGTVTASALDFAVSWTQGNIYLAGADLAVHGIATHARPYALDACFIDSASRFAPLHHLKWARCSALVAGGSHGIYASWFKHQVYPPRLFSLGGNSDAFDIKVVDARTLR